jgi:hypothetical protein
MKKAWKEVLKEVEEETNRIWLEEPLEIKNLRLGIIDTGAGTYNQYFSTLVFVDGDIRALGCYCANGLARSADLESTTLEQLKDQVSIFMPISAKFLGYCGLKTVWRFTQDVIDSLPSIETKDEFRTLLGALAIFLARLHIWVHNFFPWELGILFPMKEKSELSKLMSAGNQS